MFAAKIFLLLIGFYTLNRIIAQECIRDIDAAGRQCERPCSVSFTCRKTNRECICDGRCGYSCLKKSCDTLGTLVNGSLTIEPPGRYIGSVVTYNCHRGFTLAGDARRTCSPDKTWNGTAPVCNPSPRCSPLNEPENGLIAYSDDLKLEGTAANHRCNRGYSRSGNRLRFCQSDATWSGSEPTCIPVCPELPELANGGYTIEPSQRYVTAVLTYTCNRGYTLSGNNNRTCKPDRTWSGDDPVCIQAYQTCIRNESEISRQNRRCMRTCMGAEDCFRGRPCVCDDICGPSCIPTGRQGHCPNITSTEGVSVVIDPPSITFRSTATYSCDEGYEQNSGDFERTCHGNGEWSGTALSCIPRDRCEAPRDIPNASINGGAQYYVRNTRATYICDPGYFKTGFPTTIRCNGRSMGWTNTDLQCLPKSCGDPGPILHGRRIGTSFLFRESVRYECETGYEIVGQGTLYCQSNQQWSRSRPVCHVVSCPTLTDPTNGRKIGNQYNYGDEVSFQCDTRFIINGSRLLRCQADGTWEAAQPTCRLIQCSRPAVPVNGGINSRLNSFGYQATVRFDCSSGLTLIGSEETTCNENEEWSNETPLCAETCTVPTAPVNGGWERGLYTGDEVIHGSPLSYFCNDGYWYRPRYFKCQYIEPICQNNQWVPTATGLCQRMGCSSISVSDEHVTVWYTYTQRTCNHPDHQPGGTIASFNCSRGYKVPDGIPTQIECRNNRWSNRNWRPRCEEKLCPMLDWRQDRVVYEWNSVRAYSTRHRQNTIATLSCDTGYDMNGHGTSLCDDGIWNNTQTMCTPKPCSEQHVEGLQWEPNFDTAQSATAFRPHGTRVRFNCTQYGYDTSAEKECYLGIWQGSEPLCERIPCDAEDIAGGFVVYEPETRPVHNSRRIFFCRDGYEMTGSDSSRCDAGVWTEASPSCNEKGCHIRDLLDDDIFNVSFTPGYEFDAVQDQAMKPPGTTARLSCQMSGYTIEDEENTVTCSRGVWGPLPTCVRVRCSNVNLTFGNVVYYGHDGDEVDIPRHGDRLVARCKGSYRLAGSQENECNNQEWVETLPECIERGCSRLSNIPDDLQITYSTPRGGDIIFEELPARTTASFQCSSPFHRVNSTNEMKCRKGEWRGTPPGCDLVTCNFGLDENADHTANRMNDIYDAIVLGDELVVTCNEGYSLEEYLNDSFTFTCSENGWDPPLATCSLKTCEIFYVWHGSVSVETTSVHQNADTAVPGDIITVTCDAGYELVGDQSLPCDTYGNWEGSFPACREKRCPRIDAAGVIYYNGATRNDESFPGETVVNIDCHNFHYLSTPNARSTCIDGEWDPAVPACSPYRNCSVVNFDHASGNVTYSGTLLVYNGVQQYTHRSMLTVSCSRGRRRIGEPTAECQNGTWTPAVATCVEKANCPRVETSSTVLYDGVTKSDASFTDGTVVTVLCDQDHYFSPEIRQSTCQDGTWDPDVPVCIPYEACPELEQENGRSISYQAEQPYAHGSSLTVHCTQETIILGEALSLCQNGIWTPDVATCGTNVAQDKYSSQSSTRNYGYAHRAVDGVTTTSFDRYRGSCSQTGDGFFRSHWWYVDLGANFAVKEILIYNREDIAQETLRLIGANVRVGSSTEIQGNIVVYTINSVDTNPIRIQVTPGIEGRIVMVELNGHSLNLCEVQVFGEQNGCGDGCVAPMTENVRYQTGPEVATVLPGSCWFTDYLFVSCEDGLDRRGSRYYGCSNGQYVTFNDGNRLSTCTFCVDGCVVPHIENGYYRTDSGYRQESGSCFTQPHLYVECDDNTVLTGSYYYTCRNERWYTNNDNDSATSCDPQTCQLPRETRDVLHFSNDDFQRAVEGQTFIEGDFITSRCRHPTTQRFSGSVKRRCHNGQWTGEAATCDPHTIAINVVNTYLKEVAPNGTIFVSTVPTKVYIDCISRSSQHPLQMSLQQIHIDTTPIPLQVSTSSSKIRHVITGSSSLNSGTYICLKSDQLNSRHSVDVVFKDVRCNDPPNRSNGSWEHYKAAANKFDFDVYLLTEGVELQCEGGYRPSNSAMSNCSYNGEWTPPLASCIID